MTDLIQDATPAKYFAHPPYRVKLFSEKSGWAGVMNANGVNCLTFKSKPGAVVASFDDCKKIAELWNENAKDGRKSSD